MHFSSSKSGFTLVELAIVLVIIGLIIGGVLVGQDMIKAAEIRATIAQRDSYKTAVSVFKDKYNALPGDIGQSRAVQFGFYDRSAAPATGNGDNNGLLQPCGSLVDPNLLQSCERTLFWRDLSTVGLIDGWFQTATAVAVAVTKPDLIAYFPESKLGRGNFWLVNGLVGKNYYVMGGIDSLSVTGSPTATTVLAISPFEAYNIDRKADDGRPATGGIRPYRYNARSGGFVVQSTAAPAAGVCVSNVDSTYNQTTESFANTPACQYLRMNF